MHQKVCTKEKSQGQAKAEQNGLKNEQKIVLNTMAWKNSQMYRCNVQIHPNILQNIKKQMEMP